MIVQDILKLANIDMLADIYSQHFPERDVSKSERKWFIDKWSAFIAKLLQIEPKECGEPYVLLHLPCADAVKNGLQFDTDCVEQSDLRNSLEAIRKLKELPHIDAEHAAMPELGKYLFATQELVPQCYTYEYTPWAEVLAMKIYPENYVQGLEKRPDYNTQCFIWSLLWEMSYNGMTEAEQEEARDELNRATDEMLISISLSNADTKNPCENKAEDPCLQHYRLQQYRTYARVRRASIQVLSDMARFDLK